MTGDMGVDEVSALDLAFVVDTTGSMTGLIASAQQRMIAMIDALLQAAEVSLRLGIVEYRDHPPQDQLPFRAYDFTADLDAARADAQRADGGGRRRWAGVGAGWRAGGRA